MSRPRSLLASALAVLALTLAGCASGTTPGSSGASESTTGTGAEGTDEAPADDDATDDTSEGAGTSDDGGATSEGEGATGDIPVGDDPAVAGPDDDAVSYPATGGVLPPECGVLVEHPLDHVVVGQEVQESPTGVECVVEVDSKGDSLSIANELVAQLAAAGHEQTSSHGDDDSADAVNTFSFAIGDGELFVTVAQTGPSGILTTYAYVSPARGNG